MSRFEGRNALITGGPSGIGKATAARLLTEGACVVINGRDPERLATALGDLAAGGTVSGIAADAAREDEVTDLVGEALGRLGRIDVLVNSARIDGAEVNALVLSPDGWRRVLDANLTEPFLVAQVVTRAMATAGGGAIVNVASLNGLAAEPDFADYNASKGGLARLTRSLAVDLVRHNIRVNAVCPGLQHPHAHDRGVRRGPGDWCGNSRGRPDGTLRRAGRGRRSHRVPGL